ncbi:ATP-binding protein [Paenibacillus dendritiformis]|uniref:hybrid sensor histidine kinase/response regulator n=1 Tax=Paenibacillus dendritiformis TaxID=130049 RepID=UPI00365ED191
MSIRKIMITAGLVLVILTSIRLLWIAKFTAPDSPQAEQGVLDLRGWDLSAERVFTLNGEWEFYPGVYLQQGDHPPAAERHMLQVPGNWKANVFEAGYGYGTYRLRILIDPAEGKSLAIRVPNIQNSSELYVNGRLLAHSGVPAADAEHNIAQNIPYSVFFVPDGGEVELVIHAANFMNRRIGGIARPLLFGTAEAVTGATWLSIGTQLMVCIVLFMHVVYAIILYFIGGRQKALIYFSLLVISAIIMTLVDDDKVLLDWLQLDYEWYVKLIYIAMFGVSGFLLQFAKHLFPEYRQVAAFRWHGAACLAVSFFIFCVPARVTLSIDILYSLVILFSYLIVPVIMLRAAMKTERDAIYLLISAIAVTVNIIWGSIKTRVWFELTYYPIDLIIAFLAFATFWFKRFFRTSAQMADLNVQLIKADKVKDEFLANTSHELRTPLHGIINMAQSVLEDERRSLTEPNRKNLELIVAVGRRMSHLLNDLLDSSQLKQEKLRLQLQRVSVPPVALGVIDMLSFMTEGKPIRLEMNIPEELPPVIADEERLIQILFNLLHNAIKYTDEGTVMVDAYIRKGYAHIRVSDTGRGMDEATKRRAFQAYEQGEASATVGGIGLGLSITKQLVELHGGTLKVESEEGTGSVFTFTLPLAQTASPVWKRGKAEPALLRSRRTALPAPGVPNSSPEMAAPADGMNILAVDDDPVNLNILTNLLFAEGYNVATAMNGREAAAMLDQKRWDLIIADVMMPHMSGYELTRAVRERFSMSELPVLLLTARSRAEDIDSGFRAGANDYVTKPVEALELKSRVRALTDLRRSVGELLRMEAAYLQAQIKPHFLFNTLNSIVALSKLDADKMRALIESFSKYLRLSFDLWNAEHLVPLEHELDLVRAYLTIEKTRFGDRLDVIWDVNYELDAELPPLTIQPLVENALRHGILSRSQGGTIHIRIDAEADGIRIVVADDGVGMDSHTLERLLTSGKGPQGGIGLINTDKRLRKQYGQGLSIQSMQGEGTTVSFHIPNKR